MQFFRVAARRFVRTPGADAPHRRRRGRHPRPAASGWRCTRPATPTTTSACSTPPTASCSPATTCCPPSRPHISGLVAGADPLNEFFKSLDKVAGLDGRPPRAPRPRPPVPRPHRPRPRHPRPPQRAARHAPRRRQGARRRHRRGVQPQALPAALLGPDGRERDLRPPRAPPPDRRGHQPRRGRLPPLRAGGVAAAVATGAVTATAPSAVDPDRAASPSPSSVGTSTVGVALDGGAVLDLGAQRGSQVAVLATGPPRRSASRRRC